MTRARLNVLRVMSLFGLAVSLYLVWQHIQFQLTGAAGGFCRLVKAFDCTAIERSAFSNVYGVPLASFGALYFLIFFTFLWLARPDSPDAKGISETQTIASLLSFLGLDASITLALLSGLVVKAFCLGCTTVYFTTLVIAWFAARDSIGEYLGDAIAGVPAIFRVLKSWLPADGAWTSSRGRTLALWIVFIFGPLVLFFPMFWVHRSREHILAEHYLAKPIADFKIGERALAKGDANAPLQFVIFTDFECPYCRKFHEWFEPMLENYAGKYRLIYKHLPFCPDCNPAVRGMGVNHPKACRLAEMAQALGAMGKFWDAGGELYAASEAAELYPALKAVAERHGIDYADWAAHVNDPAIRDQVKSDIDEAIGLEVGAIPAIYLNGRFVDSVKQEDIEFVIRLVLRGGEKPAGAK